MIFPAITLLLVALVSCGLASLLHRFLGSKFFWVRVVLAGAIPFAFLCMITLWGSVSNGRTVVESINLMAQLPLEAKLYQIGMLGTGVVGSWIASAWCRKRSELELDVTKVFQ